MLTEIEHAKKLNVAGRAFLIKQIVPFALLSTAAFLYAKHCEIHDRKEANFFYNRSKLFGGAKNPQY